MSKIAYQVDIIESQRGWGQKIDDTIYFQSEEMAKSYVTYYNDDLPTDHVPDCYLQADYIGQVNVSDDEQLYQWSEINEKFQE